MEKNKIKENDREQSRRKQQNRNIVVFYYFCLQQLNEDILVKIYKFIFPSGKGIWFLGWVRGIKFPSFRNLITDMCVGSTVNSPKI